MDKNKAIEIISQVCAMFKGTLQEHQAIQEALQFINTLEVKEEKIENTK
jgi:hypothetical protein